LLASVWSGGRAVFSVLSLLIITPVVAFYLLLDWEKVVATVDGCIPLQHRGTVHGLARDIDAAIAGFVRGQAVICMILAVFYAIGLTLTGLNYGFLIGVMTGLLSFIPFVGAGTGFLVAAIVAIAQFWPDWTSIAMVGGVFLVGQVLEGYVLSPRLVGPKVGLHPVWMMFSLIAFSYLFGFVGLLVAIPLAATIGVLLRFAFSYYLESPIYTGRGPR
jgi:predicted PurR-regulated permease PerM